MMRAFTPNTRRPFRLLSRFAQNHEGATALEFALVCLPFFALIFAIIETALAFFAGQMLESATADASRKLLTGQMQAQSRTAEDFKTEICGRMIDLFDCDNGLKVDVRVLTSFGAPPGRPVDGSGNLNTSDFGFQPGVGGDIVLVRSVYEWPIIVTMLGLNLADLPNGNRLLIATSAFRNEPFGDPASGN